MCKEGGSFVGQHFILVCFVGVDELRVIIQCCDARGTPGVGVCKHNTRRDCYCRGLGEVKNVIAEGRVARGCGGDMGVNQKL